MHDLPVALPRRYGWQIEVMRAMHWSWQELLEAPADLVEEIAFGLAQEAKWTAERRKLNRKK
jgi:hypothetical protein